MKNYKPIRVLYISIFWKKWALLPGKTGLARKREKGARLNKKDPYRRKTGIEPSPFSHVDWNAIERLEVIGIDEIALKKGHRDFVVVISAYINETLHVIDLLGDRTKASVQEFFLSIPKRLRRTVQSVCSDLYQGFIGAAKAVFGKRVRICADRFHVATRKRGQAG
jgi:hypothetical protein